MIESIPNFQSSIIKPNINQIQNIPSLKVTDKILGELVTVSKRSSKHNHSQVTTELRNQLGKSLGREVFSLEENEPTSIGFLIMVDPEYRKKNFKFGEILRLSSIIMMVENCIKNFEIYSKDSAIYFHSKYKFKPNITQFKERNEALESMIANCHKNGAKYDIFLKEAEMLLDEAMRDTRAETQRRLCVQTNDLLSRYIKKVLETKGEYTSHPFKSGFSMKLTDESINENKDFFNGLLEKHNIDYKI